MAVLNVSIGDTLPRTVQFQENKLPRDLTGYSVVCRIDSSPVINKTVTIVDPLTGSGTVIWGNIPAGVYSAQFKLSTVDGDEYTSKFTIVSEGVI